ncbi:Exosome RNA helicase MTR4 [Blyttiomyces sp. JEL0837]|nr:Exosome RNA helicase MTR4 [Blyttiomyces sp. JEL0837]
MIDEKIEPDVAKGMLKGVSDRLDSAFHLSYNMILNLMRIEGISSEYMLERSFYQFQNMAKVPSLQNDLEIYKKRLDAMVIENEDEIQEYYELRAHLESFKDDVRSVLNHETYALPFIQTGRLVRIRLPDVPKTGTIVKKSDDDLHLEDEKPKQLDFGWGIIVNFQKRVPQVKGSDLSAAAEAPKYVVDVLLHCEPGSERSPRPCPPDIPIGDMVVVPCDLSAIDGMSPVRSFVPKELKSLESRNQARKMIKEIEKRFPDGIPLLDPIEDYNIKDEGFRKLLKKIEVLENKLKKNPLYEDPRLPEIYEEYSQKLGVLKKIKKIKRKMKDTENILQLDELKGRRRVLRRLGYTSAADVIDIKGRVACEISAGDELLLTEMIFNGMFGELSVEQIVALLSCFCFTERNEKPSSLTEELQGPFKMMQQAARKIAKVEIECKLNEVDEEAYVQSFRPELMEVVYAWSKGAKFSAICKMTDVFEGSIIRSMRLLEELLRQMVAAAKAIGNTELETKFAEGINKIRRDIVFAASLYL